MHIVSAERQGCESVDFRIVVCEASGNGRLLLLTEVGTKRNGSESEHLMIPIRGLFEAHLNVADLQRAMSFYGETLGLELANVLPDRRVAFYWLGGRGRSMLGLWEVGTSPQRTSLHMALEVDLPGVLQAVEELLAAGIPALDLFAAPATEPAVFAWMPAASIFFRDPDGNLLEFIAMLSEPARPEMGVTTWSAWKRICDLRS